MLSRVELERTEISVEIRSSFIKVTRIGELGNLALTSKPTHTAKKYKVHPRRRNFSYVQSCTWPNRRMFSELSTRTPPQLCNTAQRQLRRYRQRQWWSSLALETSWQVATVPLAVSVLQELFWRLWSQRHGTACCQYSYRETSVLDTSRRDYLARCTHKIEIMLSDYVT
jgi:hypothetical protein